MDIISLNEYVFIERGYISLNELIKFLGINIISCQNIIAKNDYPLNEFISLQLKTI